MWCYSQNHESPYNLRWQSVVKLPGTNTTKYGINSPNFKGAMLWNIMPKKKLSKIHPEFNPDKGF